MEMLKIKILNKIAVFDFLDSSKLISRKIWLKYKGLDFQTVLYIQHSEVYIFICL